MHARPKEKKRSLIGMATKQDLITILYSIIDRVEKEHVRADKTLDWKIAKKVNRIIDIIERLQSGYYHIQPKSASADFSLLLRNDLRVVGFEDTEVIAKQVESGEFYQI